MKRRLMELIMSINYMAAGAFIAAAGSPEWLFAIPFMVVAELGLRECYRMRLEEKV